MDLKKILIPCLGIFLLGLPLNYFNFNLGWNDLISIYFWIISLFLASFIGALGFSKSEQSSLIPFSLPLGFLFITWLCWVVMHLLPANITPVLALLGGAWAITRLRPEVIVRTLVYNSCFLFVFWGFLFLNSFHPEIFWGEKPMDLNLLSFFQRNTQYPPEDPWLWGKPLKYYYFGYFMYAKWADGLGVSNWLAYHLSLATSAGFFFLAGLSLMRSLGHRFINSVAGATALISATSMGAWLAFFIEGKKGANAFWGATRVFKNQGFAEYPFWSFIFADLHPHVMSYPFALFAMVLLLRIALGEKRRPLSVSTFILGFCMASLVALSAWDAIFICFLFGLVFLSSGKEVLSQLSTPIAALIGGLCWSPILFSILGGKGASLRWYAGENNTVLNYLQHQGLWWLLLIVFLVLHKVQKQEVRHYIKLLFGAFLILWGFTEFFVFIDRMNTIFKFGNLLFITLGVIVLCLYRDEKKYNFALAGFLGVFLASALFDQSNATRYNAFGTYRPSLRGLDYLSKAAPAEKTIARFISREISGTPLIIESWGKSFENDRSRISYLTGLPSYLGWEGHVLTRGADARETLRRKKEIDGLYNNIDPLKSFEWLKKRGINYVVVSSAEHGRYNAKGLAKFEQYVDLFVPVIQTIRHGKTMGLYKVGK